MIYTDTHLHTSFSSDSDAPMEDMILGAIKKGLKTICITEHLDYDYPDNEDHLDFLVDLPAYFDTFAKFKEKYEGKIELLLGIELGVKDNIRDELNAFYQQNGHMLDFTINSCHLVRNLDPYYKEFFEKIPVSDSMRLYFEAIYNNLQIYPDYQTAGHLDYLSRYQPKPWKTFDYSEYGEILDAILLELIRKDKALEVNTAGLKYGLPWPNPDISILKRYKELGGQLLTIGSDAHKPEHLAYDFDKVPDILKSAGFKEYVVYRKQKPCPLPLG